jgi:hypothetical protein
MQIDELTGKTKECAEACYSGNSIGELEEALAWERADRTDCEEWGLTEDEWREAIQAALADLQADR